MVLAWYEIIDSDCNYLCFREQKQFTLDKTVHEYVNEFLPHLLHYIQNYLIVSDNTELLYTRKRT